MASRRRPRAKTTADDDEEATEAKKSILTSSSDDDEANRDLSLAVVEFARSRIVQKKRDRNDIVLDDLETPESRKKSRKKRKKIKASEFFADLSDENVEERGQIDNQKVLEAEELIANEVDGQVTQEDISGVAESVVTTVNEAAGNAVLRKLLRGPRYFDPGESTGQACFNCNEEGHMAVNCPMEKRQKPCFICGLFGHIGKQCKQGQECFICKRKGHYAKDCPDKQKKAAHNSTVCLWCGDTGHDMYTCRNDYSLDDLKEIQCYVCKQNGHLCCVDLTVTSPEEVSCYKCGGSGHTGLGCAKMRPENNECEYSPVSCYKCGEEGHFARGCKKATKSVRSIGESSTPRKHGKGARYNLGFKSVPNDSGKGKKRKKSSYEDGRGVNNYQAKKKGSWISDRNHSGDLHGNSRGYTDSYARTPVRKNQDHSFIPDENFSYPDSYYKNIPDLRTPNYQSPSNSYQQRWSESSRSIHSNRRYW